MINGSLIETFKVGGIMMWPLLFAALSGIAMAFERIITLHRIPKPAKCEQQLEELENIIKKEGMEACAKKLSKGKGILNYIFARLLKRYDALIIERKDMERHKKELSTGQQIDPISKSLMEQVEFSNFRDELLMTSEDASTSYVTKFLPALNTVAQIAPLMGLLGTVTGMISAFQSIATSGTGDPKVVAAGISEALITTATGLFIAVPGIVIYRYLGQRADSARSSVELYAISFANTLLAQLQKTE